MPKPQHVPSVTVSVYDPAGYEKVKIEVKVGDRVEYHQNGVRGTRLGTVQSTTAAKNPLCIQPHSVTGVLLGRPIWRGAWGVVRAWREGVLLGIPAPFEGKVLRYEPATGAGGRGEIEIERLGSSPLFMNSSAPGWPCRVVAVGETVRCEMREAAGFKLPVWFIQ